MFNNYSYSDLYLADNGVSLMDEITKDPKVLEYKTMVLDENHGMFSPKMIDIAKKLINQKSEDLELRKDVKDFLESPEFDKEMTEVQMNIGLNPADTVSVCIECMIFLGNMYDMKLCKKDKGVVDFLVKYSIELKSMGYKDLIDYILDKYSEYFIKEVA